MTRRPSPSGPTPKGECTLTETRDDQNYGDIERRHSERHAVDFELYVTEPDRDTRLGDIVNISLSGMCITSAAPIPVDTMRRIQLNVVLGESATIETICCETHILWSRYEEAIGCYVAGCANTFSPLALDRIKHLLNEFKVMTGA